MKATNGARGLWRLGTGGGYSEVVLEVEALLKEEPCGDERRWELVPVGGNTKQRIQSV